MRRVSDRTAQGGAALIVALLILVVISVIGVAAMRSSSFSAKMAMGTQLDAMVFEGAESGIDYMLGRLQGNSAVDELVEMMNGEIVVRCITGSGNFYKAVCGSADFMDSRGMLQVETRATTTGFSPAPGNQISSTGGGGVIFADFKLTIQGDGTMPAVGLQDKHIQHALRRGMIPVGEIQ